MTFSPHRYAISGITKANPAVVTTATANVLTTGQVVRLHVPQNYGMIELDNKIFSITVLTNMTFSLQYTQVPPAVNVDSSSYRTFTIPSKPQFTAEVICVGAGPTPILSPALYKTNNVCESLFDDALANDSTVEIPF